jgi:hypothetical protein
MSVDAVVKRFGDAHVKYDTVKITNAPPNIGETPSSVRASAQTVYGSRKDILREFDSTTSLANEVQEKKSEAKAVPKTSIFKKIGRFFGKRERVADVE